ncbi:MAG: amidohydrolase [Pseudomonadota bacterium]
MSRRSRLALPVLITLTVACERVPRVGADRVFINGGVYTVDENGTWAEAVAVDRGEVVFVGGNADARELIGDKTEVIDLSDRMLLPSFHDAHAHVRYGGTASWGCNLGNVQDLSSIRAKLTDCASSRSYGEDEWVLGGGWPLSAFPEGSPTADLLDEVFGERPAFFSDAFGHNAWVSSRALELAGIDRGTPDPPQGVIVRDSTTGEATGTLRDGAMALVEDLLPEQTPEQQYRGLMTGLSMANAFGITAYVEPGVSESNLEIYRLANDHGELTARVLASLSPIDELPGAVGDDLFALLEGRDAFQGEYLAVDSVKIYIDGVIETRTSYMLEPYLDGTNFDAFYEIDALNDLYVRLDRLGVQIHTHAIGDAAIRRALDAYEFALIANGPNDNRHQIVHLQLIDEQDIPRFAKLNVAANFQCTWCYPDVYIELAVDLVGVERAERFYPVRSVQESGGLLVGGSDWDVSSLNPLDAIETAVRRQDPNAISGPTLGAHEAIDLASAIAMYTRNAAYVMRLDAKSGAIEAGKRADLIVLDRNLFEIPNTEINEAQVLLTLLDGNTVYRSENW